MNALYPVIFTKVKDGYLIEVPDLDILTEADNDENEIDIAADAISLIIITKEDKNEAIPSASDIASIDISKGTFANEGKSTVSLVEVDTDKYRSMI